MGPLRPVAVIVAVLIWLAAVQAANPLSRIRIKASSSSDSKAMQIIPAGSNFKSAFSKQSHTDHSHQGSKFFHSNGTQFFIQGIDYPSNDTSVLDPLADSDACTRDIPILQGLGTNVVRIYSTNASASHSTCMSMFNDAGIYVFIDLSTPDTRIARDAPVWSTDLYSSYTEVIDAFAQFTNVMGFFVGSSLFNSTNTATGAFVKAAVRDMKAYLKSQNYENLAIGYAHRTDDDAVDDVSNYLNCGFPEDSVDFFGLQNFKWCGLPRYDTSGFENMTNAFSDYSVPSFLAEYGCTALAVRLWVEIPVIYGSNMTNVLSGGMVYQYVLDDTAYGLVSLYSNTASKLPNYTQLSSRLSYMMTTSPPARTESSTYTPTNTQQACPTIDSSWRAATELPPTPNSDLCACIDSLLVCVPKTSLNESASADIMKQVCSENSTICNAVATNATTGSYGALSMCDNNQRLSWAMSNFYLLNNNTPSACDFGGRATIQSTGAAAATTCKQLLAEAGVTAIPSNPAASPSSSPSSSGSHGHTGSKGLSSGAEAGIAIGAIFLLALLAIGAFLLWRRRKKAAIEAKGDVAPALEAEKPPEGPGATELDSAHKLELQGGPDPQRRSELPAGAYDGSQRTYSGFTTLSQGVLFGSDTNRTGNELEGAGGGARDRDSALTEMSASPVTSTRSIARRPVGSSSPLPSTARELSAQENAHEMSSTPRQVAERPVADAATATNHRMSPNWVNSPWSSPE